MSVFKNEPTNVTTTTTTTTTSTPSFSVSILNSGSNKPQPPPPPPPQATPKPKLLDYYWTTIDEKNFPTVALPCIYRQQAHTSAQKEDTTKDIPYVCVRIIERTILTQFEHMNSPEIKSYGCLLSQPCTQSEVDLLNEINTKDFNFGVEAFDTQRDSMVKLSDFLQFYNLLITTCPVKATSTVYQGSLQPILQSRLQQPTKMTTIQLQPIPTLQVRIFTSFLEI